MLNFKRNILIALCLAIIYGCSSGDLEYTRYRVPGGGGGIVNDSMALFAICVEDYYFESPNFTGGGGVDKYVFRGYHLTLADIRTEKIYWQKEIPVESCDGLLFNSMHDSVLFFIKERSSGISEIAFLDLKDKEFQQAKQVKFKSKKIELKGEAWEYMYEVRIRPWHNGLILANSRYGSGNNYALLDTTAGTMEQWEPSGEFEWLNECADVRLSPIGGLCLKGIPDTLGFVLLKDGMDTLAVRYLLYKKNISEFRRGLIFSGNGIISGGLIYLMDKQRQVSEMPLDFWVYHMGIFYNLHGLPGIEANYCKDIYY